MLGVMHPGDLLRSVRQSRRLSQRELAGVAGVRPSTVDRIESGRSLQPSMALIEKILLAAGYRLVVANNHGNLLVVEDGRFRPCDRGGRNYPAHLEIRRVRNMDDPWWGWHRVGFYDDDPKKPDWTFDRGHNYLYPEQIDARWDDAT